MDSENIENANEIDVETQEARAFLRERFLKFIASLSSGYESEIHMFENATVKANLRGFDLEFENIAVENLQTNSLPVNKAILRSSDIISIHLSDIPFELLKK